MKETDNFVCVEHIDDKMKNNKFLGSNILIDGLIGSGKTNCLKLIMRNIYNASPETEFEVIDLYLVKEFSEFSNLKDMNVHIREVDYSRKELQNVLNVLTETMETRCSIMRKSGEICFENMKELTPLVIVISSLDSLIQLGSSFEMRKTVEEFIIKFLQLGPAMGIYIVADSSSSVLFSERFIDLFNIIICLKHTETEIRALFKNVDEKTMEWILLNQPSCPGEGVWFDGKVIGKFIL